MRGSRFRVNPVDRSCHLESVGHYSCRVCAVISKCKMRLLAAPYTQNDTDYSLTPGLKLFLVCVCMRNTSCTQLKSSQSNMVIW